MEQIKINKKIPKSNSIQMILKYALKSKKEFVLMVLFMIIGAFFSMFVPRITAIILNGVEDGTITKTQIYLYIGLAIILSLGSALVSGVGRLSSAKVGTRAIYYLRSDVYHAINRQTYSYFDKTETGQLIARATSDISTTFPAFNMAITLSLQSIFTLIMALIGIQIIIPEIAWISYIAISIFFIIIIITAKKMRPIYLKSRNIFGELTTTIRENILGANVVRIFNSQNKEKDKFDFNNREFTDLTVSTIKLQTLLTYSGRVIVGFMVVAGLYFAGRMVIDGLIGIGTAIGYLGYVTMLGMPLFMMNRVIIQVISADAAITRVKDVLDSMPDVLEKENPIDANSIKGDVEFKNINFGYTLNLVLKDINFKVPAGSNIAILGTTGSGKSTLMSLLPRFYDVTSGELLIDGIDIRDYKLFGNGSIRSKIATCSQNIFLFNESIADNIRFGREDATLEQVIEAAKSANIHKFIKNLPDGYDTMVGERGTSLSGGQKQRVAIARALITQPRILILDDSTSAVDVETEYKIQQALQDLMKNKTSFVITQRISTIRNSGKIIVMDRGKIVGIGTHEELYKNNALYCQIFETLHEQQKKSDKKLKLNTAKITVGDK